MPSELVAMIEGMALRRPPPRAAEVHRAVTAMAGERGGRRRRTRWCSGSLPDRTGAGHSDASRPDGVSDGFEPVSRQESAHPDGPGDVGARYRRDYPAPRGLRRRFSAGQVDRLCGHWLRAGFVCQARRSVAGIRGIQWRNLCNVRS